ncbi:hypothetical protein DAC20_204 [Bacteroides phage DAC20]|nr:hypothetical protein DAC16_199 [Bacteroides phage DAC16]QIG63692.1 hypothetical protein DAC19_205 [Bacteroides phage DAC19]QIG63953.1 hypothetical protein DAC20_204 [Bacteroides phage DAC20]QIG64473.1 hypothetical protein DAC23_199 [Bacteroides phage DAC23]
MKNKINEILNSWNQIQILKNDKLEKENNILSCIQLIEKSVNENDAKSIQLKQKGIASNLIEINNNLYSQIDNLGEVLKGFDEESLKLGKFSINLLKNLIYSGISIDSVKKMKEILKCFNEEKYSDIPLNQELNRVGLNYSSYFISK